MLSQVPDNEQIENGDRHQGSGVTEHEEADGDRTGCRVLDAAIKHVGRGERFHPVGGRYRSITGQRSQGCKVVRVNIRHVTDVFLCR